MRRRGVHEDSNGRDAGRVPRLVGTANGLKCEALITAMDAPLGRAVGNALEVIECIETLKGRGPKDLEELSVTLAARMVRLAGLAGTNAEAEEKVRSALQSGAGLEKFRRIVEQQGGDPRIVHDYDRLPRSPNNDRDHRGPGRIRDRSARGVDRDRGDDARGRPQPGGGQSRPRGRRGGTPAHLSASK